MAAKREFLLWKWLVLCAAGGVVAGCSTDPKIVGKREQLLAEAASVTADPATACAPMKLPQGSSASWPQANMQSTHGLSNLPFDVQKAAFLWKARFGARARGCSQVISNLVARNGEMLFGADAAGNLVAFHLAKKQVMWSLPVATEADDVARIGGLAIRADAKILVTTSAGDVLCVDPLTQKITKKINLHNAIRSPACVLGNAAFLQTANNTLFKLDKDLNVSWRVSETPENVVFLGNASPAADERTVVAAFSDGEYKAYDVSSGSEMWNDFLMAQSQEASVANMLHIRASPVLDTSIAIVIGNGGKMIANDITSGEHLWNLPVAGLRTPALVNDWVFVIDSNANALCVGKRSGKVRWCSPAHPGPGLAQDWLAPIIAGNTMICIFSDGVIAFHDTSTGKCVKTIRQKNLVPAAAIVLEKKLYVLASDGELYAFG